MIYTHQRGIKKQKKVPWLIIPFALAFGGAYLLINALSPGIPYGFEPADSTATLLRTSKPALVTEDRLYIPKLNLKVAIVPSGDNEAVALEKGAVNRAPASGNPKDGGNYVLAAHRFNLGFTPQQTRAKSPFYHIDKLGVGDEIYIDYRKERYVYKVDERKSVKPTAVEIEARTDLPRLTMYSCELAGQKVGREVIIAHPVGKIVESDAGTLVQQPL